MIFRLTKTLLFSILLSSLLIGNISLFAIPKDTQSNEVAVNNESKKSVDKPTTDQVIESITENTTVDNTLLIKVKEGEDVNDVKNELKDEISGKLKIDKKNIKDFDASDDQVVALQFDDTKKLKDSLKVVTSNSKVEEAQPNYKYKKMYTPNDTEFNSQWYLKNQASSTNAQSGWDAIGAKIGVTCGDTTTNAKRCGGENNVKIAVIDSGINLAVADFAGAPVDVGNSMRFFNQPGGSACPVNQTYVPANGLVVGWQYCQSIGTQFDEDGHGTGVASLIMSQDNAVGGVGIAHNTTILPIALHNDTFNTFFISEAIKYAQNRGAKVINLSLGTPYYDSFLERTINNAVNAGVTVVAASGNCAIFNVYSCDWDNSGTQNQPEETNNTPMYPSAFASVIAVGASNYATTAGGVTRSCYSNYGNHIDIVAPVGDTGSSCNPSGGPSQSGVRIPCGFVRPGCATVDTFISGAGTSYAAPMVAGAVGLLLGVDNTLNPTQIKDLLQNTATDVGIGGRDNIFGSGVLNVGNLMQTVTASYVPTHYFPWTDNVEGQQTYVMVSNPNSVVTKIKIKLNNGEYRLRSILPGNILIERFLEYRGGPVVISTENGINITATERSLINYKGVQSFSEVQATQLNQITNKYYYTWHDTLNSQNLVYYLTFNPSTTQNANVTIKIAGLVKGTYVIPPGQLITPEFKNFMGGPIEVTSDINVYSTQRVLYNSNGKISFNEIAGIPFNKLSNIYSYNWHHMLGNDISIPLVGNPSTTQNANVTIKIAGLVKGTYVIPPGGRITPEIFNLVNGPVEIKSDIDIYTTQRVLYNNAFNEFEGIK